MTRVMNKILKIGLGALAVLVVLLIGIRVGQGSTAVRQSGSLALRPRSGQAVEPQDISLGSPRGILPRTPELEKATEVSSPAEGIIPAEETEAPGGSISERLVIKTGNLSLLVKNTQEAVGHAKEIANKLGGFVLSARTYFTDEKEQHLKGEITIKVPQERFDEAINKLKNLALKVKSEYIQGRDVTEEYTDLESRLRNLEATETQLLEIMKRSGKIPEVLEVQRELTRVRGQIETTKGRIKYLSQSAKMSAITCHIATEEEELPMVEEKWRPLKTAKAALRQTIAFWQSIGSGAIWLLVFGTPLLLLAGITYLIFKSKHRPPTT